MSPQPRNTKIMSREGPWGRAGWFRSRYLTLTDATAGRLERSRRHGAAEHPHPLPPPPGQVDGCPGRPQPQAATPPGGRREASECVPAGGMGGRIWRRGSGGRALQGTGGSNVVSEGTLALRCGCGCEKHRACYCACLAVRLSVCGAGKKSVTVCVTKITLVCVLGVTQGWRVRLMSLKWVWPHHSGVDTNHSPAPFQSQRLPGGCEPRRAKAGKEDNKESHRPHHHQVLSHADGAQRPLRPFLPGLLSLPLRWWSPADGHQAGHHGSGDTHEGLGVSCGRGCWAGGGLTIPSTGCIIKKSLQAGGQSRV